MHIHLKHVFLALNSKLYQWPIPDMRCPESTGFETPAVTVTDLVEMTGVDDIGLNLFTYLSPQGLSTAPNYIAIKRGSCLSVYQVRTHHTPDSPHPHFDDSNISPVLLAAFHDVDPEAAFPTYIQPCDEGLVCLLGTEDVSARFIHIAHPNGDSCDSRPRTIHTGHLGTRRPHVVSLCAATGRLCVLTQASELYILDYLPGNVDRQTGGLNSWGVGSGG